MNRHLRLAALVAGVAIVAAACSSGTATTAPSAEAPSAAAPSAEAPSAEAPSAEAPSAAPAFPTGDITLTMWTKEGESDGALQFAKKLAADYKAIHANVTITVINKDVEKLRTDFQSASLASNAPELLWTVSDHIGPFTAADLILPLDDMIDTASYVPSALQAVQADGKTWGAPISYGNQLMLYWNKDLAGDTVPADFDALIATAKTKTDIAAKKYGLVFPQVESFWLVPFLGGFGGSVFAADGVTPTLDTPAMVSALQFMKDLKFTQKIMPNEATYNDADGAFKNGDAPFIINGDWTLGDYSKKFGDKLGLGPIPKLPGGDFPKPYVAGAFFMVSKAVGDDADKKAVVSDFIKWATAKDQEIAMVNAIKRLPGNAEAIADPVVTADPLLNSAAEAAKLGVGTPTSLEMRCVFDAMTKGVKDMFTSASSDPAALAKTMQSEVTRDIAPGAKCGPA